MHVIQGFWYYVNHVMQGFWYYVNHVMHGFWYYINQIFLAGRPILTNFPRGRGPKLSLRQCQRKKGVIITFYKKNQGGGRGKLDLIPPRWIHPWNEYWHWPIPRVFKLFKTMWKNVACNLLFSVCWHQLMLKLRFTCSYYRSIFSQEPATVV